jgi:hypothetical protein
MGVSLANLVSRLRNKAPARDGVPDSIGYQQCVEEAVADFGRRKPCQKISSISIISGTAEYDLPSDFGRIVAMESLATTDEEIIISDAGIIPLSGDWEEKWTVAGRHVTFYPTPTYTKARDIWYQSVHVLDSDEQYPDLTEEDAAIVLLYAQSLALGLIANSTAGSGWKYTIGDESVDKSGLGAGLRGQADWLEKKYLAAVKAANGAIGMRGTVPRLTSI